MVVHHSSARTLTVLHLLAPDGRCSWLVYVLQVFKTIDEVLAFLELTDAWTAGDRGASGLVWVRCGPEPPSACVYGKAPRELRHPKLSTALAQQLDRANGKAVETTKPAEGKGKAAVGTTKAGKVEPNAARVVVNQTDDRVSQVACEASQEEDTKKATKAMGQAEESAGKATEKAEATEEAKQATEEAEEEQLKATPAEPLDPERLELKEEEWKRFAVSQLSVERYVRVEVEEGAWYYVPEDADDKHEARPKTYSSSFAEAGCTSALLCKKLDDRQLEHTLKIEKLGDRMRLLEQFRFL